MITSVGSILYFTGLVHVKAQNASIISLLEPVSAIFFAYILFKDPISAETLLGCALILLSSLFVSLEDEKTIKSEISYTDKTAGNLDLAGSREEVK
jgi:drug/metabolite transporter (DMT)-like permease